ncbi:hypothetical protein [Litoreibacter roseus]|uniref:Uncharacterized protein n=1 Tax=Litoreibacter roseus TaxID=2601869 RepID=A0A6N6JKY1_9RHOB|nr:hypothetical protein [Litoreibacter roseus]GFE66520.1 hypothetical protein KIN_35940 [Litoreibacter roseus]
MLKIAALSIALGSSLSPEVRLAPQQNTIATPEMLAAYEAAAWADATN